MNSSMAERSPVKGGVIGSSPVSSAKWSVHLVGKGAGLSNQLHEFESHTDYQVLWQRWFYCTPLKAGTSWFDSTRHHTMRS